MEQVSRQERKSDQTSHPGSRRSDPANPTAELLSGTLSPAAALDLQRLVGNEATAHLFAQQSVAVQRNAVHEALRSAGRPLDDGVRTEMEGRLGADFSDVRVHTDATADVAAESVQAHAFTSGSHIVFQRGRYNPDSAAGKRMLAHELTHVTQQRTGPVSGTDTGGGLRVSDPADPFERAAEANATRAMSAPVQQVAQHADDDPSGAEGTTVQRAVGFEMEVPRAWSYAFAPELKEKERGGANVRLPDRTPEWARRRTGRPAWRPQLDPPSMARIMAKSEQLIVVPDLFTVEADESIDGNSDLEFVTVPFPETAEGRTRLAQAIAGMVRIAGRLGDGQFHTAAELAEGVTGATVRTPQPPGDRYNLTQYVLLGSADQGNPQVTAGIPLANLVSLFSAIEASRNQPDSAGDLGGQDRKKATDLARQGVDRVSGQQQLSEPLRGLLMLVTAYLISGNEMPNQPYYKGIAPIMGRTDFASMFRLLPPAERVQLSTDDGNPFVELALRCASLVGTEDKPVLASVAGQQVSFTEVTREVWLSRITQGIDVLSRQGYARQFPGDPGKAAQFESMGSLGGKTDTALGGRPAPIVELRRMGQRVPREDWEEVLLGVFDLITDVVTGGASPTYARATTTPAAATTP